MNKRKKMPVILKIWLLAVVGFGVLMVLFALATTPTGTALVLRRGETARFQVFRLFATPSVHYDLRFDTDGRGNRPELGEWVTNAKDDEEWEKYRIVRFDRPGEPVHVTITLNGQTCRYEALPVSSRNADYRWRDLSTGRGGEGKAFDFAPACRLYERAGWNEGSVCVEKVGAPLEGERVRLSGSAPLSFKWHVSGSPYNWLWPMFLWEIWAAILAVWGIIVGLTLYRRRRTAPSGSET